MWTGHGRLYKLLKDNLQQYFAYKNRVISSLNCIRSFTKVEYKHLKCILREKNFKHFDCAGVRRQWDRYFKIRVDPAKLRSLR